MRRSDGSYRWLLSIGKPILNSANKATHLLGVEMDITQQREFQTELQMARDAAQAANASKSEFVANMSHEIRTPMTAILGYSELVYELITNPEAKQHLDVIRHNEDYLLQIINDILDLSKIEAGKLEIDKSHFQPVNIIEDVRKIMEFRARERGSN